MTVTVPPPAPPVVPPFSVAHPSMPVDGCGPPPSSPSSPSSPPPVLPSQTVPLSVKASGALFWPEWVAWNPNETVPPEAIPPL
ncbi:hypothetical protein ACFQZU_16240 [Streptomonospora algeriensis]|uniref:Uncharacterized protein n=1 Tax=Streptomonospora algeriensis TaxID=995084 RepID=A0ABW3BKI4_9ACTN